MNDLPTALPLTPDACTDTTERHLAIEISPDMLRVLIPAARHGDASEIYVQIPLSPQYGQLVKSVEEAVYANPLLLCDFKSATVVLRDSAVLPVPAGFGQRMHSDSGLACETITEPVESLDIDLSGSHDADLLKFLRRSFNNPRIISYLAPLCAFCGRQSRRSNRQRAYVQFYGKALDILLFEHHQLRLAASYTVSTPDDALYFVMAACEASGFDRNEGEMMLLAGPGQREGLQPVLRRYVNYVMPLILPADLCRDTPLELAIASLPNITEPKRV